MKPRVRRFEFRAGTMRKFWEVWVDGENIAVRFGKLDIGSNGQTKLKHSDDPAKDVAKMIAAKLKEGYVEEGPAKPAPDVPRPIPGPTVSSEVASGLQAAYWKDPTNLDALRVWADAMMDAGEPRGEFIQLHLVPDRSVEQTERIRTMYKQLGGKLVGPARPFLRSYYFGNTGLVNAITTEAPNLIKGFEAIAALNPRLAATVTSLKKKACHAELAKLPLHRLGAVILDWNGMADDAFVAIAPALAGVKNLSLAYNNVTEKGLRAAAPHLASLEYLALDRSIQDEPLEPLETVNGWVDALCDVAAFKNLKAIHLGEHKPDGAHLARLKSLRHLKTTSFASSAPVSLAGFEAMKRGEPADSVDD